MLLGEEATEEDVARLNRVYGFDRPLHEQYLRWLKNALRETLVSQLDKGFQCSNSLASGWGLL